MKTTVPRILSCALLAASGAVLLDAQPKKAANNPASAKSTASIPKSAPAVDVSKVNGYRVGPGDVLQVVVWKEPDASVASTLVRADGKITLPLVRELDVDGKTPSEIEATIAEKLAPFIKAPEVSVVVKESHSKRVYMVGAIKREGPINLLSQLTVMQAIAEAGGVTDFAKPKKIYVLRVVDGKQVKMPFDYKAALRGERTDQNILLQPNDTVVIPK